MAAITTITIDGQAQNLNGNYDYQTSGHGMVLNNANTVRDILQAAGIGTSRLSGNSMCNPLPNKAKNNQGCYHTHDASDHQVFFNWAFNNGALTISTVTLKHG